MLVVASVCVLALLAVGCSAFTQEAPTPPNIVFILADDLDYTSALKTPAISRLASEGASFENAFNSYPLCCPSRTTILTGLYAHNHGVKSNSTNWGGGFQKFKSRGLADKTVAKFYDLAADPYELENLIDTADPALIADYKAKLAALKDCSGQSCREAEDAP